MWNSTRPTRLTSRHPKSYNLPEHIRALITQKRRARATWQRIRYPSIKQEYNRLTRELKTQLYQLQNQRYQQYTESLSSKDLWTATRKILSYKALSHPFRREDGSWARTDEERANFLAQYLSNTFVPHPENRNPQHYEQVLQDLDTPLQLSPPPKPFHPSEVKKSISNLSLKKSPGYDLITPVILRHLPKKSIVFLTYLYNAVLRTTHFPTLWKFATIILIHKPKKPTHLPSSYRPISLLPTMGKILERLLLTRISPLLEDSLPDHQFGFRSFHSTTQQCHRVVDVISSSLEQKQYCPGVFLDITQAFDRVWHEGLLWKLKGVLSFTYYLILKSYLSNRSFWVKLGSSHSPIYPILAGVPQGSAMAPLLYSYYTADIPTHSQTILFTYADDTAILAPNSDPVQAIRSLQSHLNSISYWQNKWRIKANPTKSQFINFTLRRTSLAPVHLHGAIIPTVDKVRYLGFHLDK